MFGFTGQDGTEGTSMYAPIRYDNMDRFSILRDVTYDPQPGAKAQTAPDVVTYYNTIDEYIRLGDRECVFSGQSNPMTIEITSHQPEYASQTPPHQCFFIPETQQVEDEMSMEL